MYLINHYLYTISSGGFLGNTPVPNKAVLNTTNAASGPGSLGEEAETTCPALHGRAPTFLLVDFYDYGSGSVFEVAAKLNGVTFEPKSYPPVNGTDGPSSTSTTGGTSSNSTGNAGFAQGSMMATGILPTTVVGTAVLMVCAFIGSLVAI